MSCRPSERVHSKSAVVWSRWPCRMRCRPSNSMHSMSAAVWPRWSFRMRCRPSERMHSVSAVVWPRFPFRHRHSSLAAHSSARSSNKLLIMQSRTDEAGAHANRGNYAQFNTQYTVQQYELHKISYLHLGKTVHSKGRTRRPGELACTVYCTRMRPKIIKRGELFELRTVLPDTVV